MTSSKTYTMEEFLIHEEEHRKNERLEHLRMNESTKRIGEMVPEDRAKQIAGCRKYIIDKNGNPIYCGGIYKHIGPHTFEKNGAPFTLHEVEEQARRGKVDFRYDLLDNEFLRAIASVGNHGAKKYGDFNYTKSRLVGIDGPINHIFGHIVRYQANEQYDHDDVGHERKYHLAAIAFNAMMEFWYECHPEVK